MTEKHQPHFYPHFVNMDTSKHKTKEEISDLFDWLSENPQGKWSMIVTETPMFLSSEMVKESMDLSRAHAVILFTFELLTDATMFKLSFI